MTNKEKFRLCGGTFFTLLLRTRKQRMGVREHYKGMSDGMADPVLLMALAEIAIPNYRVPDTSMMGTVKSAASRYKSCQANGGTYFPFSDGAVLASFDDRIKTAYGHCLAAMNSFVDDYIDVCRGTKKDEYLVKALVEVIDGDDQIEDDHAFYICEDGSAFTKREILSTTHFCLQSFLLGVWHYIILNVKDNKVGEDTYNRWCPSRGGAERVYVAMLGENSERSISLYYSVAVEEETCDTERKSISDVEIGEDISEQPEPKTTQTMVNHNPIFNTFNIGSVGTFNNQVDHITNNYYGDKKDE